MTPNYVIGTGFYNPSGSKAQEFYPIWYANTYRHANPERVLVLANGGSHMAATAPGNWVYLDGNLGHAHDLSAGRKPHVMCGWSAAFVTLAMMAYSDERDFIFKEQDCLAFGPWVETMYHEIGDRGMIFGSNRYACAQAIVLCRHAFIPEFVRLYMGEGSEQAKSNECELKFARLERQHPDLFGRFSFGVDRDRPIPYDAEVFYVQQIQPGELAELRRRILI